MILGDLWQSLLKGLSTNELEQARIEDLCRACDGPFLKPSKRCIPWYRLWRLVAVSASSTFWLSAYKSSLCRSSLLESCCVACLSVLSRWLLGCTEGLGNRVSARCLPSPPAVFLTSTLCLFCRYPTTKGASFLYLQCSQYKDLHQLACFE